MFLYDVCLGPRSDPLIVYDSGYGSRGAGLQSLADSPVLDSFSNSKYVRAVFYGGFVVPT